MPAFLSKAKNRRQMTIFCTHIHTDCAETAQTTLSWKHIQFRGLIAYQPVLRVRTGTPSPTFWKVLSACIYTHRAAEKKHLWEGSCLLEAPCGASAMVSYVSYSSRTQETEIPEGASLGKHATSTSRSRIDVHFLDFREKFIGGTWQVYRVR